jgi:hypothetical protein
LEPRTFTELIVEGLRKRVRINGNLQALSPAPIVTGAVEHGVDVERFADDREKDPVRKTPCENAADIVVAMDDAK